MKKDKTARKQRPYPRIIAGCLALLVAAGIFYLSSIPASGMPSHSEVLNPIAHFLEYMLFAALLTVAVNSPPRKLWISALIAIVIASLYGASDELHQLFVAGRHCDPMDWLVDTIGALVGASLVIWLIAARRVKASRRRDEGV
ncbi:MAG: VanZ family protein [Coriobacteriia bacterium]|nr:VanZ family protein [Coriobacteriia bacterium]